MSAKNNNLKGKQREVFNEAFDRIGGLSKLVSWATELDENGKLVNYSEFLKHYVKLVPPIKPDKDDSKDTQESFIMGLIKADNILKIDKGKPKEIIEVNAIPIDNGGDTEQNNVR
jgi:hypothetical protein